MEFVDGKLVFLEQRDDAEARRIGEGPQRFWVEVIFNLVREFARRHHRRPSECRREITIIIVSINTDAP